ncbi:MAG TPA: putative toxin-antitoxin system toxin component, PIN family [Bacteroidia bacterium]|jgi:putative PIN family toxin of toxin-antitoxin system|nr:putative toxin-antitoxin system toxin component, PIN family [Bacteroidia bacterium]
MPTKQYRIILDTNLWISFLITKNYSKLDSILFSRQCVLVFSKELLTEFIDVIKRPKFNKYVSHSDVEDILKTIEDYAEYIEVKTSIEKCRDPKDNFLLSLSLDGKADFLLTGDAALLEIKKIGKTRIITIAEFLSKK